MPAPRQASSVKGFVWVLLFAAAAVIWSVYINRPVDLPNWHELDYSAIARNYFREGSNLFFPRIDWRGSGPGFTEMEFPIIPWAMAQSYRIFGIHEIVGRIMSVVCMLSALWVFRKLALKLLPETAAFIAVLFFAINHEISAVASAILPEPLMLLLYLLAVYYFVDWYETKSWFSYASAIVSFASAVLVKEPAAHLAIFFFAWALWNDGLKAFRRPSAYVFAVLSFTPALLWYTHAASLWHRFHNSMGVSNEDHWFGLDMLTRPKVFGNFLSMEVLLIFGVGGLLVVAAQIFRDRLASRVNRLALSWCLAVAIYLMVILRTAAGYWAAYYHVVAVPPIALLFGAGIYHLNERGGFRWRTVVLWLSVPALVLAAAILLLERRDSSHLPGALQDLVIAHESFATLTLLVVLCFTLTALFFSRRAVRARATLTAFVVITGCFAYFLVSGQLLLGTWYRFANRSPQFNAVACLRGIIPANSLIVSSGGICADAAGHRAANDAPNMFYWLDKKGFTTCEGNQSVAELKAYTVQGARYFIADAASLAEQPGLDAELRKTYPLLADCGVAELFQLMPPPAASP